ncbi:uncharacterized protein LOC121267502 isoform X6 [Juglans microcarpa x Juglans regia]|uniref:uncharacterized protein LOC121267502 isoform X6 n=2 Tax=Juglans microcarpa x Juglans regia TaxID=2249226 RepID=UPI001B7F17CF|nr:uncharacterized protein LOC121267502 isoform X6 [Juglans microcarpa x Juglans regia]
MVEPLNDPKIHGYIPKLSRGLQLNVPQPTSMPCHSAPLLSVHVAVLSSQSMSCCSHSLAQSSAPCLLHLPQPFCAAFLLGKLGSRSLVKDERWSFSLSVADSDSATTKTSDEGFANAENEQSQAGANKESGSQASEASNGSTFSSDLKQETSSSPNLQSTPKRSPLTAKERLRAARVLNRYMESKATKSEMGSKVLDALRASDGGKKRSGLPEAPTNLFDDSKRGMPKQGLTFEFPGGFDLFIIAFSFVFISTVMFATTYIVWKVGAIHFNEY